MAEQQFHSQQHLYLQPQCYQTQYITQQNNNETLLQLRSLQEQVHVLQQQKDQMQKELNSEKQRILQLQQQLVSQQQLSSQMQQQYEAKLRALHFELSKYKTAEAASSAQVNVVHGYKIQFQSHEPVLKFNADSICDVCQFKTRSEVSLFLHRINHSLTQKHLQLPTTIFTTKNHNSSFLYKCPACDNKFTRHEIYTHIYQVIQFNSIQLTTLKPAN